MDNDVWRGGESLLRERVRVEYIPLRNICDNDFIIADKFFLERAPQHALPAGYQDLHSVASFSLASRLACVMHAPRSTICQLM